jgi:AhpD family alkylhydroperoxidase
MQRQGRIGQVGRVKGMSKGIIERFRVEREELNEIVMHYADLDIKRFYSLDSQVYRDGALPKETKELLGLVASLVLRCDDCIKYHIIRCDEEGVTSEELVEALAIALVVGGSITIPHLRRALQAWDELQEVEKQHKS